MRKFRRSSRRVYPVVLIGAAIAYGLFNLAGPLQRWANGLTVVQIIGAAAAALLLMAFIGRIRRKPAARIERPAAPAAPAVIAAPDHQPILCNARIVASPADSAAYAQRGDAMEDSAVDGVKLSALTADEMAEMFIFYETGADPSRKIKLLITRSMKEKFGSYTPYRYSWQNKRKI